jgi:hypothetical protein
MRCSPRPAQEAGDDRSVKAVFRGKTARDSKRNREWKGNHAYDEAGKCVVECLAARVAAQAVDQYRDKQSRLLFDGKRRLKIRNPD